MSEPFSGTAAGVAGWKALAGLAGAGGIAAAIAAYVVMMKTKPKDDGEFGVAMACTVVGSLGGGPALIKYLGIEGWSKDIIGLMGLGGIIFACGLPAWVLVRASFLFAEKRKGADLAEIVRDVKEVL